jgi:hypothetical protein
MNQDDDSKSESSRKATDLVNQDSAHSSEDQDRMLHQAEEESWTHTHIIKKERLDQYGDDLRTAIYNSGFPLEPV